MVLTSAKCEMHIKHALGRGLSSQLGGPQELVNQAGNYLVSMHRWKWLERPFAQVNFTAPISFTAATWTESTKTITKVAAFAAYTFQPLDRITITAGSTGVVLGSYEIASKTSNDVIVLAASISSTAANLTGVAGTISFNYAALPSDFAELVAYDATASTQSFSLTTLQALLEMRASSVGFGQFAFLGAIEWAASASTAGGAPTPRLALFPTPTAFLLNALTIQYRAGWREVTDDQNQLSIPAWTETLYLQILRHFAKGYEEDDQGDLSMRLGIVTAGPLFTAAKRRDGLIQPSYGMLRGGALRTNSSYPINSFPLNGVTLQ